MKGLDFKPIDPREIPGQIRGRPNVLLTTVGEFVRSGAKAVEVNTDRYKTAYSAASGLRKAIKRERCESRVRVLVRRGRVFLVRTAA